MQHNLSITYLFFHFLKIIFSSALKNIKFENDMVTICNGNSFNICDIKEIVVQVYKFVGCTFYTLELKDGSRNIKIVLSDHVEVTLRIVAKAKELNIPFSSHESSAFSYG